MEEKRVQEEAVRSRETTIKKKMAVLQDRDAEITRLQGILFDTASTA